MTSLDSDLHWAAEFLPAQGPLTGFIHHNTLHAFQHLPFEQAVTAAAELYNCQPYMSEEWYRAQVGRGRITPLDIEWALDYAGLGTNHRGLKLALLGHQLYSFPPAQLSWHLAESGELRRLRRDVDAPRRDGLRLDILEWARGHELPFPPEWNVSAMASAGSEQLAAHGLWLACHQAVAGVGRPIPTARPASRRASDALVHPILIRWCAAFLDQGVAGAGMPARELGLYGAIRALYAAPGWLGPRWLRDLPQALAAEPTARQSLQQSLALLGLGTEERREYLRDTALSLRGWAGMMYQSELRPDRLPFAEVPARFEDFCALFLLLERFALPDCPTREQSLPPASPDELAYELYQVCQFLQIGPATIQAWSTAETTDLLQAVNDFGPLQRRHVLHLAYERNYEVETLEALLAHQPHSTSLQPAFQAVFCIDEREESTRRHLEEIEPNCQTFGTAGFFGVPMYYKALHEPHPVALCPVVIKPRHLVEEIAAEHAQRTHAKRQSVRRSLGRLSQQLQTGSHSLTWGSLVASAFGLLGSVPSILRVLFPRRAGLLGRRVRERLLAPATRLRFVCNGEAQGEIQAGFSPAEMATIVGNVLRETGLAAKLAPLVLFIGHGSSSLNNPHEAAHDCGACGGGRGGPNARVFAAMANLPEVRALLREEGLDIPADTRFVGAYHNTCDDHLEFYDTEEVGPLLQHARSCLLQARSRDAQERCRRFESASPAITAASALAHVQARSEDLAQPRPEYGHATNATCIVARRSRTRGLFMDRRAFLVSYDPELDDDEGTLLGRILNAVVPVGAGINLEYYFSFVDNDGYGCGTKLPHNITGLLGVMDGHSSDLRTGLPWQMVEIHEPVRLLAIVETTPELLGRVLERLPHLLPWAANGWIKLGLLDPDSQQVVLFEKGAWVPYHPVAPAIPQVPTSREWFRAKRKRLGYAEIQPAKPEAVAR